MGVEDESDWTEALDEADGRYVKNFRLKKFKGYADRHTLELDLGMTRDGVLEALKSRRVYATNGPRIWPKIVSASRTSFRSTGTPIRHDHRAF